MSTLTIIFGIVAGVLFFGGMLMVNRAITPPQSTMGMLLLIAGLVLGIILALSSAAFGHDHNRPGLDSWYSALRSGKGPCCGGPKVDATVLVDADWQSKDGRYRVRIEGQWHDVPEDAVLSGPNLDGRTLVWPIKGYSGLTIRCFMPGAMT